MKYDWKILNKPRIIKKEDYDDMKKRLDDLDSEITARAMKLKGMGCDVKTKSRTQIKDYDNSRFKKLNRR